MTDTTAFDTRESNEAAAEADENLHRRYEQRIADLEYGIDAALDAMSDLDDGTDLAQAIANARQMLTAYRNPQ
ncbi:hypothetical protein [Streptomyces sp. NPDC008240]|uniref:hypothetical protein n=1 Tax=Streptomyces sp. NPDC008240 TaxID=3364822 RepID=UPI0036EF0F39